MGFPQKKYKDIETYTNSYFESSALAAKEVDRKALAKAATLLIRAINEKRFVWVCGNGGSAAIANHLICDYSKGIRSDTNLKPRVISLASNVEMITAISNDIKFDDIFLYQLESVAQKKDVLITISSSGDSENIVRAVTWARKKGIHTISMTGFEGGRAAATSDINLHVNAKNYGIVEDIHQSVMHILAQFMRMSHIERDDFVGIKF